MDLCQVRVEFSLQRNVKSNRQQHSIKYFIYAKALYSLELISYKTFVLSYDATFSNFRATEYSVLQMFTLTSLF